MSYRIATLSVPTVIGLSLLVSLLAYLGWGGAGTAALAVWTYAIVVELHRAAPAPPPEDRADFERLLLGLLVALGTMGALKAVYVTGAVLARLLGPLPGPLDPLVAVPFFLLFGAVGGGALVYSFLVVRHVLSALRTVEVGRPTEAAPWVVVLCAVSVPVYLLTTHLRVRAVLRDAALRDAVGDA